MAITVTRLQSDGTLLLNGEFDEYTYAGNIVFESSTTNSAVFVTGEFDEVTYNLTSPTIVNIWAYTQDFTNEYWFKSSSVSVANTTDTVAPDGSLTAQKVTVGGSGTFPYIKRPGAAVVPCVPGTTYTVSVFVKYINQRYMNIVNEDAWTGGMTVRFDLLTGTVGTLGANVASANLSSLDSGWMRISVTYTPVPEGITYWNPQPIRVGSYDGQNYSGSQVYVWGAQLIASSSAGIYQPVAAAGTLVDTGMSQRVDGSGNQYVTTMFDEFTGAPVINSNLLIWLDAGQTTSYAGTGTTWTDLSGLGNNGTLVGGTGYDPRDGGALTFDGTDDYVSFAANPSLTNQITVEAYVDLDLPLVQTNGWILGREGSYRLIYNNGQFQWICATVNNGWYTTGTAISASYSTTSGIYQVVGTYDGSNLRLYVNGALATTGSAISGNILTSGTYWVGRSGAVNVDYTRGRIFLHRLYSVALITDEVSQNFNANRRRYGI